MSDEIETIDKNPKSWAAWKREAERLQGIIEDVQRYNEELREWNAGLAKESCEYQERIAELESRTVTVKQYDEFQICHYGATEDYAKGYIDCQNNFFKWLNTAGIKWEAE
ncbi:TPA: hypothetical protein QIZ58_001114 [Klebsiella aerogenes]|nr:hypothetical protein [Klebsiella aerogenes]